MVGTGAIAGLGTRPRITLNRLTPVSPDAVDVEDTFLDRMRATEIMNGTCTRRKREVVDDDESARADFLIHGFERLDGRFVEVAVHALDREPLDRGDRQRSFEPAFKKVHTLVKQFIGSEIGLDRRSRYG